MHSASISNFPVCLPVPVVRIVTVAVAVPVVVTIAVPVPARIAPDTGSFFNVIDEDAQVCYAVGFSVGYRVV